MSTDTKHISSNNKWRKIALRCAVIAAAPFVLVAACGADDETSAPSNESSMTAAAAGMDTACLVGLGYTDDDIRSPSAEDVSYCREVAATEVDEATDAPDPAPMVTDQMVEAEWQCLYDLGYPNTDDAVWVSDVDKAQCQQVAVAQAAPAAAPASAVAEDDPAFDCRTNGNRTCGPDNADGVAPGCYVDGQLAEAWSPEMYGRWTNCGPVSAHDAQQQARLDGEVAQVCAPNDRGGVTCDWADDAAEATVPAEDGTSVPVSFYDRTDYNRDGVVDQEQGFGPNPSPAEVQAG